MTLFYLANVHRTLSKLQQAKDLIEEGLKLMHSDNIPKLNYNTAIIAHCYSVLGMILIGLGDFEHAHQNLQVSLDTHNRIGTHYGTINPLMGLGWLAYLQGNFLKARDLYLQALETARNINDQHYMVLIHNRLGAVYEVLANPAESYHHVLSALKFCQETGDHRLTAVTLNNLAYEQLRYLHQPAESIWTYHKCLEIFSSIGDLRGITYTSYDISRAYLKVGLLDEAWNYCLQSLDTARTLDSTPLILHALHGFANLFVNVHQPERALRLCYLLINHPQIETDTQKRAIVSKVELETTLSTETIQASRIWGETTNLQDVINQILAEKYQS
jgi:tetratricopeptide (TPR) repeat protein